MTKSALSGKLDWNHLLGFEQVVEERSAIRGDQPGEKLGMKVGGKVGDKVGNKIGTKIGTKTGLKTL